MDRQWLNGDNLTVRHRFGLTFPTAASASHRQPIKVAHQPLVSAMRYAQQGSEARSHDRLLLACVVTQALKLAKLNLAIDGPEGMPLLG